MTPGLPDRDGCLRRQVSTRYRGFTANGACKRPQLGILAPVDPSVSLFFVPAVQRAPIASVRAPSHRLAA